MQVNKKPINSDKTKLNNISQKAPTNQHAGAGVSGQIPGVPLCVLSYIHVGAVRQHRVVRPCLQEVVASSLERTGRPV